MKEWSSEDVQVMAGLIVNAMVSIVESILEAPKSPAAEEELRRIDEKQLRMVALAAPAWRSRSSR